MTAPSARVFPLTVLGLSRCCPPAVHSTLSARVCVSLPRQSCPALLSQKVSPVLSLHGLTALTGCLLLCRTKWQREKSADLTTVLRSRPTNGLGIETLESQYFLYVKMLSSCLCFLSSSVLFFYFSQLFSIFYWKLFTRAVWSFECSIS